MSAGRPTKRTPERIGIILDSLRQGATLRLAAMCAGIDEDTLMAWRRADPELAEQVNQALGEACMVHTRRVAEASVKDWRASAYFLNRHDPTRPPKDGPPSREGGGEEGPGMHVVALKELVLRALGCGVDIPTTARILGISQVEVADIRSEESARRGLESDWGKDV